MLCILILAMGANALRIAPGLPHLPPVAPIQAIREVDTIPAVVSPIEATRQALDTIRFEDFEFDGRYVTSDVEEGPKINLATMEDENHVQENGGDPKVSHNARDKAKMIQEKLKACTPEERQALAVSYPAGPAPRSTPAGWTSALPQGSFYQSHVASLDTGAWGCQDEKCQLPAYLKAREQAAGAQLIPRIIWMTVSDNMLGGELGPFHYNMLAEHFMKNPEYEWVVSGDKASDEFMNSGEVKREWSNAYKRARNGAEKADIWRYAVMYKYGGVYMDSDMSCHEPYRTFVDPTANITQTFTPKMNGFFEASQFAMMFTPGHKVLESALDEIAEKFESAKGVGSLATIDLTGPSAMARAFGSLSKDLSISEGCGLKHALAHGQKDRIKFNKGAEVCESQALGKMRLLAKARDFDTGKVWHKDDVCALQEANDKFGHWSSSSKDQGGKGTKGEKATKALGRKEEKPEEEKTKARK